jgi:hypothetical protein
MSSGRDRDRDMLGIWLYGLSTFFVVLAGVLFLVLGVGTVAWLALACGLCLLGTAGLRVLLRGVR